MGVFYNHVVSECILAVVTYKMYMLTSKPAFGEFLCYGASSTALQRKCFDASVLSKGLVMSAMLMTELGN